MSRFPALAAGLALALWSPPVLGAKYEMSGAWVFQSVGFAEADEKILLSCVATTESLDGTVLALGLEPAEGGGVAAGLSLENPAWQLGSEPVRLRFDIGAARWMLAGQADGSRVDVSWSGDAALLPFLEDLASSSFAGLVGRDGANVAQFSLKGSRGAIEAMKACIAEQIGAGLDRALDGGAGGGTSPF